ncbi:hypothetical protein D9M71_148090 [compost metagenome]
MDQGVFDFDAFAYGEEGFAAQVLAKGMATGDGLGGLLQFWGEGWVSNPHKKAAPTQCAEAALAPISSIQRNQISQITLTAA